MRELQQPLCFEIAPAARRLRGGGLAERAFLQRLQVVGHSRQHRDALVGPPQPEPGDPVLGLQFLARLVVERIGLREIAVLDTEAELHRNGAAQNVRREGRAAHALTAGLGGWRNHDEQQDREERKGCALEREGGPEHGRMLPRPGMPPGAVGGMLECPEFGPMERARPVIFIADNAARRVAFAHANRVSARRVTWGPRSGFADELARPAVRIDSHSEAAMSRRAPALALLATLVASAAPADPQLNCVDFRVGSAIRVDGQRVAADGATDPAWAPDPSRLCVAPGHEVAFSAIPMGDSAVIVTWTDPGRNGSNVRAQRLEAGVGVTPTWPSSGIVVAGGALDQAGPRAANDGAGGAFLAWQDFRSGRPRTFAQRIDAAGAVVAAWPPGGLALGDANVDQVAPVVTSDGSGGALVAWQEFANGLFTVRVVRLTGAGVVSAGWASVGVVPCASPRHQLAPVIASDDAGGALVVWEEPLLGVRQLRAARVNTSGVLEPGWPAAGLVLAAASGQQRSAAILRDGSGGAFVTWQDTRSG